MYIKKSICKFRWTPSIHNDTIGTLIWNILESNVVFLSCEIFNSDLLTIVSKARNSQVTFAKNPTTANALRPNLSNLSRGSNMVGSTENCIVLYCFKI